jgi:hypothetical protein
VFHSLIVLHFFLLIMAYNLTHQVLFSIYIYICVWHHVSFLARKYVAYSYLLNRHTKKTNFPVLSKLLYQLLSLQIGRQKIINELPKQVTCKALKPFSFITQTRTTLLRSLSLSLSLSHTHTHTHTHKERETNIWEKYEKKHECKYWTMKEMKNLAHKFWYTSELIRNVSQ